MRCIVLGAGVIGITSAYYLAQAGHEVVVVDRQDSPAQETSFANGGQISASHSAPWASPDMPMQILQMLGQEDAPLLLRLKADPYQWRWALNFLFSCRHTSYIRSAIRNLRLALYSLDSLKALRRDLGLAYDHKESGILYLFHDQKTFDKASATAERLKESQIIQSLLSPEECHAIEPGLAYSSEPLIGGYHSPVDELGDARAFTTKLAEECAALGVEFRFGHSIQGFDAGMNAIRAVKTDQGTIQGDHYVLAAGSFSRGLAKDLGLDLPLYPVKGYSVTLPVIEGEDHLAPLGSLTDEKYRVVISRLGDRVRCAGSAEFIGYDLSENIIREQAILKALHILFPRGSNYDQVDYWCGLRPMTSDSSPILGATPFDNLSLNIGHGTYGWTMSCGSAKVISDLVSGKRPEINVDDLTLARFSS